MQCVGDGFCDVGVIMFAGLEDAHQDRLRFGTVCASVQPAVFSHHDGVANRSLRMIVIENGTFAWYKNTNNSSRCRRRRFTKRFDSAARRKPFPARKTPIASRKMRFKRFANTGQSSLLSLYFATFFRSPGKCARHCYLSAQTIALYAPQKSDNARALHPGSILPRRRGTRSRCSQASFGQHPLAAAVRATRRNMRNASRDVGRRRTMRTLVTGLRPGFLRRFLRGSLRNTATLPDGSEG